MKQNNYYNKITDNKHEIVVVYGEYGYSKLVLVVKGVKVFDVKFKDNRQTKTKIYETMKTARRFTHLDNALKELAEFSTQIVINEIQNKYSHMD